MELKNLKMKKGSQIIAMLQRLHKEYHKCLADTKRKGPVHPDTTLLLGMITFGTWLTTDTIDKQLMEKLDTLFDKGPIEKTIDKSKQK